MGTLANHWQSTLESLTAAGKIEVRGNLKFHIDALDNGKVVVMVWRGKASKPYANYLFRDATRAGKYCQEQIDADEKSTKYKADRQRTKSDGIANMRAKIQVGTILVNSWGYEQTNVDAYQVVDKTDASVRLHRIEVSTDHSGSMSGQATPVPDAFVACKTFTKRITAHGVSFKHGGCDIWDGKRSYYVSWYG
jgi:hypothetical protein